MTNEQTIEAHTIGRPFTGRIPTGARAPLGLTGMRGDLPTGRRGPIGIRTGHPPHERLGHASWSAFVCASRHGHCDPSGERFTEPPGLGWSVKYEANLFTGWERLGKLVDATMPGATMAAREAKRDEVAIAAGPDSVCELGANRGNGMARHTLSANEATETLANLTRPRAERRPADPVRAALRAFEKLNADRLEAPRAFLEKIEEGVSILRATGHAGPITREEAVAAVAAQAVPAPSHADAVKAQPRDKRGRVKPRSTDPTGGSNGKHGGNPEYLTARIARDAPAILERMKAGEFPSVRAAARAAGILKPLDPVRAAVRAVAKLTAEERRAFVEAFDAAYPGELGARAGAGLQLRGPGSPKLDRTVREENLSQ